MEGRFTYSRWPNIQNQYTFVTLLAQTEITEIVGNHWVGHSDLDVNGIYFKNCDISSVPRGMFRIFKNLRCLRISGARITKLVKDDFIECGQLNEIWFTELEIEYLPGNLFENMPELEVVTFDGCNIKYVHPDILDCLPKLKVALFEKRMSSNKLYDLVLEKMKKGFSLADWKKEFEDMKPPAGYDNYHNTSDVKFFLGNESSKDFTICADGEEFTTHKFIVAARSSRLAEEIFKNPTAIRLNLKNFKKKVFKDVLYFIYEDKLPQESNVTTFELYSAATRLGIDKLKVLLLPKLISSITDENALEIMISAGRHGFEDVKKTAFEVIKKMFPGRNFDDDLIDDVEKVKILIKAKSSMEQKIKSSRDNFYKGLNSAWEAMDKKIEKARQEMEDEYKNLKDNLDEEVKEAEQEFDNLFEEDTEEN